MAVKKKETKVEIDILEVKEEVVTYCLLGRTPLIFEAMSFKVKQVTLQPMTTAEKKKSGEERHYPLEEFHDSVYRMPEGPERPATFLAAISPWFKNAIKGAAADLPEVTMTQIGRLVWVLEERLPLYGLPRMLMSVTRNGYNGPPDIRTRCIVPEWATRITVSYHTPMLNATKVSRLVATAGGTQGAGGWRPEKGSGSHGKYEIVKEDDPRYQKVLNEGGFEAQVQGMEEAAPYDDETSKLYSWYVEKAEELGIPLQR